MKRTSHLLALTTMLGLGLYAPLPIHGETIRIGDTREMVLAALGRPAVSMSSPSRETLYFERGKVVLEEGKVSATELITDEELADDRVRREKAEAYGKQKRHETGVLLKQAKLTDTSFRNSPAWQQVAFWQDFRSQYPQIPVDTEYALAVQKEAFDQVAAVRDAEREHRIARLEAEVREANARAREAEARAREAEAHARSAERRVAGPDRPVTVVVNQAPAVSVPRFDGYWGYPSRGYGYLRRTPVQTRHPESRKIRNAALRLDHMKLHGSRGTQASSVFRPPLPSRTRSPNSAFSAHLY